MTAFTLLNTRPQHQAHGLNVLVKEKGGVALACPTMSIELQALVNKPANLNGFDYIVFISVNAVNAFVKLGFKLSKSEQACLDWFAIGKATYQAATQSGLPITALSGEQFDSECLLQHPDLQRLNDRKVLIVKGQNGRDLLAQTFKQRGAVVEEWPLYRRQPLPLCKAAWQTFKQANNPIVLATSVSSLECLIKMIKDSANQSELNTLLAKRLVVFSQRIKTSAIQLGWVGAIAVVSTQSDQAVIDCIIESRWDK